MASGGNKHSVRQQAFPAGKSLSLNSSCLTRFLVETTETLHCASDRRVGKSPSEKHPDFLFLTRPALGALCKSLTLWGFIDASLKKGVHCGHPLYLQGKAQRHCKGHSLLDDGDQLIPSHQVREQGRLTGKGKSDFRMEMLGLERWLSG